MNEDPTNAPAPAAALAAPAIRPPRAPRVHPLRDAFATFVVMLAASLVCTATLAYRSRAALEDEVREELIRTARLAATQVDVEQHQRFVDASQETSAEYARAITPLARLQAADPEIAFIYTCIEKDGEILFVLDPTPAGDADGDGVDDKSHVMQNYPDAADELRRALNDGVATASREPYRDAWGAFMSGYAPLMCDDGRVVGVVGVDLAAAKYEERLAGVRDAFVLGGAVAVALALLGAFCTWLARRAAAQASARESELISDLCVARDAAQAGARAKAEFLANVSHEFRTPMNGVLGMSELLLSSELSDDQREMAGTLRDSAVAFTSILGDMLTFAEADAGRVTLRAEPFDVRAVVESLTAMFAATARERGLMLVTTCPAEAPERIVGDRDRVRMVLMHLISNACKFTPAGSVKVAFEADRLGREAARIRFVVTDTGIGIPASKIDSIFGAFEQVDSSTTRRFGGAGIGLSLARRFARMMGGDVTVESREGAGSKFVFEATFPIAVDRPALAGN